MKLSELTGQLSELKTMVEQLAASRADEAAKKEADEKRAANEPAKRVAEHIGDGEPHVLDLPKELRERQAGLNFARITRAYACAETVYRGNLDKIPAILSDLYHDRVLANAVDKAMPVMLKKSMQSQIGDEGGLWVIPAFAADFIAYLRPKLVIFQLGARPYPMGSGTTNISTLDAGTSGYWVGEVKGAPPSRPKTGRKALRERFAGAKVVMSNVLLKDASQEADQIMLEDMAYTLKLLVETAAFKGKGTDHQPAGLDSMLAAAAFNKLPDGDAILQLRRDLLRLNVPMMKPGLAFNADVEYVFYSQKDNMGRYMFKDEMDNGTLFKIPYQVANVLPTGVDGHGKSDIYFGDWNEFLVGDRGGIQVAVSREAMYTDENGNAQSAIENRETVIFGHLPTDFQIRHNESFKRYADAWTK